MKKILLSGAAGAALLMFAAPVTAGGIFLAQGEFQAQDMKVGSGGAEGATADGGQIQGQAQVASIHWSGPLATSSSTSSVGPITINIDPFPAGNKAIAMKGGVQRPEYNDHGDGQYDHAAAQRPIRSALGFGVDDHHHATPCCSRMLRSQVFAKRVWSACIFGRTPLILGPSHSIAS